MTEGGEKEREGEREGGRPRLQPVCLCFVEDEDCKAIDGRWQGGARPQAVQGEVEVTKGREAARHASDILPAGQ